jgi:hypothetical protein
MWLTVLNVLFPLRFCLLFLCTWIQELEVVAVFPFYRGLRHRSVELYIALTLLNSRLTYDSLADKLESYDPYSTILRNRIQSSIYREI